MALPSKEHCAEPHVAPLAIGVAEPEHGVLGQDDVEDQAGVEEPPVRVLQDQRGTRLAGVLAVWLRHGTRGW